MIDIAMYKLHILKNCNILACFLKYTLPKYSYIEKFMKLVLSVLLIAIVKLRMSVVGS